MCEWAKSILDFTGRLISETYGLFILFCQICIFDYFVCTEDSVYAGAAGCVFVLCFLVMSESTVTVSCKDLVSSTCLDMTVDSHLFGFFRSPVCLSAAEP